MSDDQDFAIDAGDRETAAGPMPAPPPLVVIQYRNRGLPAVLVPPAMIVMAALAILSYQRLTPARRPDRATALGDPARPRSGRTILVEPPSSGVAIGPIVVRGESSSPAATTSPVTAAVEAAPKVAPGDEDLSPFDLDASAGRRPVEPPPRAPRGGERASPHPARPRRTRAPAGADTGPALEAHLGPDPNPAEAAGPPKPGRAERPAIGFKPPSSEPPDLLEPPEPEPPRAEPEPTKEEILAEIRREAAQKEADRRELEARKPDGRLLELVEVIKKTNAERATFHQELRQTLKDQGDRAGPAIEDLCNQYGRNTLPEIQGAVKRMLKRSAAGLTLPDQGRDDAVPRPPRAEDPGLRRAQVPSDHPRPGRTPRRERGAGPRPRGPCWRCRSLRLRARPRMAWVFRPGSQPVAAGPKPIVPSPGSTPLTGRRRVADPSLIPDVNTDAASLRPHHASTDIVAMAPESRPARPCPDPSGSRRGPRGDVDGRQETPRRGRRAGRQGRAQRGGGPLQAGLRATAARHAQDRVQARGEARRHRPRGPPRPAHQGDRRGDDPRRVPGRRAGHEGPRPAPARLPPEGDDGQGLLRGDRRLLRHQDQDHAPDQGARGQGQEAPDLPRAPPGQDGRVRQGREQDGHRPRADPRPGRPELRPRRDAEGGQARRRPRPGPVGPDRGRGDADDDRRRRWRTGTARRSARSPRRGSTASSAC